MIYMIRRKDMQPWFFLYDSILLPPDIDYDLVLWTPNQHKAREFYTEQTVEEFLYEHLQQRPCEIICVD